MLEHLQRQLIWSQFAAFTTHAIEQGESYASAFSTDLQRQIGDLLNHAHHEGLSRGLEPNGPFSPTKLNRTPARAPITADSIYYACVGGAYLMTSPAPYLLATYIPRGRQGKHTYWGEPRRGVVIANMPYLDNRGHIASDLLQPAPPGSPEQTLHHLAHPSSSTRRLYVRPHQTPPDKLQTALPLPRANYKMDLMDARLNGSTSPIPDGELLINSGLKQ